MIAGFRASAPRYHYPMSEAVALPRDATKEKLCRWLSKTFALRVHMALILAATFASALLATKLLLMLGVHRLAIRYAIATIAGYGGFLVLVKLWLYYVGCAEARASAGDGDPSDWIDIDDLGTSGGGSSNISLASGGGKFGGGGSSGSWGSGSSSVGKGGGFSFDIDGDDLVVILLFVALALIIIIAAVWLIWAAPAILGDAAFESAMTAALIRHTRHASSGTWIGSILKKTALPFILILGLAITAGWFAQKHCPDAMRLRDVIACVKR